ncbi:MAG: hypothetical protein JTT11_07090 [Candidatus Brockarchaeota archaeon]|nr:hypothetical protein [Candidatus Brockarchaeota archaeon]
MSKLLGMPYATIRCPRCGTAFPIPLAPSTTRHFGCPVCGSLIECAVSYDGRVKVSSTTFEERAAKEAVERAVRNVEEFKKIGGAIFCPNCGFDVSSEKIRHEKDGSVVMAYTVCARCGRKIEWASVQI